MKRDDARSLRLLGTLWLDPAAERAGDAALGLWLRMFSYAAEVGRTTFSTYDIRRIVYQDNRGKKKLEALVTAGLLEKTEDGYKLVERHLSFEPEGRSYIPRKAVFARDGWHCVYCGAEVCERTGEIDHVMPKSRGGSDDMSNLVAACMPCNRKKRDKTPEEWLS